MGTPTFKGVEYPDYYPALIDKKRFDALQERMDINFNRKSIPHGDQKVNNLFSGKCKCKCGGNVGVWSPACACMVQYDYHTTFFCSDAKAHSKNCQITDRMRTDEVEMDFFMNVLQEPTGSVIANATQEVNTETATTRARLNDVEASIDRCVELTQVPNMPLDKISAQLAGLQQERITLKNQLAQLNSANFTQQHLPNAYVDIRGIVKTLNKKDVEEGTWGDYNEAATELEKELKDQTIRKQLLPVLASLVERVNFDLELNKYRVTFRDGRITNWRSIEEPTLDPFAVEKKPAKK
jgi:hypothetical protein